MPETSVHYAGQEATPRQWLEALVSLVVLGGALAGVGLAAAARDRTAIVVWSVVALLVSVWFGDARRRPGKRARFSVEVVFALATGLLAGGLLVGRTFATAHAANGLLFAGLASGLVAVAIAISAMRAAGRGGFAVAVLCVAVSAGCAACFVSSAPWFVGLVAVAFGVGLVAVELTSEASNEWFRLNEHGLVSAVLGAAGLVGGYAVLVAEGASSTGAVVLLAIGAVVVWVAASATDTLVVVAVGLVALTWAAMPRHPDPAPVLPAPASPATTVVYGAPGDDAGLARLAQTCIGPGDCSMVGQAFLDQLRLLPKRLDTAYDRVRRAHPRSPIVAVPYPVPAMAADARCAAGLLTTRERTFVAAYVGQLDQVIHQEAVSRGFSYLSTMPGALAHPAPCGPAGPRSIADRLAARPRSGDLGSSLDVSTWTSTAFAPDAAEQAAMAKVATAWFAAHPALPVHKPLVPVSRPVLSVAKLGPARLPQCRPATSPSCSIAGRGWQWAQARRLFRTTWLGLLLGLVGAWLLLSPGLWWVRRREVTTMGVGRRLARPLAARVGPRLPHGLRRKKVPGDANG